MAIMLDIYSSVCAADEGLIFQAQMFGGCVSIHVQILFKTSGRSLYRFKYLV
jgi:hypothetical protein